MSHTSYVVAHFYVATVYIVLHVFFNLSHLVGTRVSHGSCRPYWVPFADGFVTRIWVTRRRSATARDRRGKIWRELGELQTSVGVRVEGFLDGLTGFLRGFFVFSPCVFPRLACCLCLVLLVVAVARSSGIILTSGLLDSRAEYDFASVSSGALWEAGNVAAGCLESSSSGLDQRVQLGPDFRGDVNSAKMWFCPAFSCIRTPGSQVQDSSTSQLAGGLVAVRQEDLTVLSM